MKKARPHFSKAIALAECEDRLRREARKVTAPRRAILEVVRKQNHPLSLKEIWRALPRNCCNLATVYRMMHLLESMRLVKRFDFGDGRARFEWLGDAADAHHHHLICTRCSEIIEIEDCFPKEFEDRIAARSGFKAVTHRLEFFGVCPVCQSWE